MPIKHKEVEGLIISVEKYGENLQKISLCTSEDPSLLCFKRNSKQLNKNYSLDLFDSVQLILDQPKSNSPYFVVDQKVTLHRQNIATSYQTFEYACKFNLFLMKNSHYIQEKPQLFDLAKKTLDSFNLSKKPTVTYIKAIYSIIHKEGLPIKESWLKNQPCSQKNPLEMLLKTPVDEVIIDENTLMSLSNSLSQWIKYDTDFIY